MRCPKCHYLSFEPEARCRNCGYDLALSDDDLVIKADDGDEPLQDFDLHVPAMAAAPVTLGPIHATADRGPGRAEPLSLVAVETPPRPMPRPVRAPSTTTEMPLFLKGIPAADADSPLVPMPTAPRAPLAVRRRSADLVADAPARLERPSHVEMTAHLDSVWAPMVDPEPPTAPLAAPAAPPTDELAPALSEAGVGPRVLAAAIDAMLLGGIDALVIWFTIRLCALTFGEIWTLPLPPLVAFFLLIDVGYLLLFTATSGQTLGKMAAGLRVVGTDRDTEESPSLRQAIVRSLAAVPSIVALGAGFLPALFAGGLSLHDRVAHTRVVRA